MGYSYTSNKLLLGLYNTQYNFLCVSFKKTEAEFSFLVSALTSGSQNICIRNEKKMVSVMIL